MNPKTYFTIISTERSGTSFLVDALNNEKNIRADYEIKWRPKGKIFANNFDKKNS